MITRYLVYALIVVALIGCCLIAHVMGLGWGIVIAIWFIGTLLGTTYPSRLFGENIHEKALAKKGIRINATLNNIEINRNVNINDNWSPAYLYFNVKHNNKATTVKIKKLVSHVGNVPYKVGEHLSLVILPNKPKIAMLASDLVGNRKIPLGLTIVYGAILIFITGLTIVSLPKVFIPGYAIPKKYETLAYVPSSDSTGFIWSIDTFYIKKNVIRTFRIYDPQQKKNIRQFRMNELESPANHYQIETFENKALIFNNRTDTSIFCKVFCGNSFEIDFDLKKRLESFPEFGNGIYSIQKYSNQTLYVKNMLGRAYYYNFVSNVLSQSTNNVQYTKKSPNNFFIKSTDYGDEVWFKSYKYISKNEFIQLSLKVNSMNTNSNLIYSMYYNSHNSPKKEYALQMDTKISGELLMTNTRILYESDTLLLLCFKNDIKNESRYQIAAFSSNQQLKWLVNDERLLNISFKVIQATDKILVVEQYNQSFMGIDTQSGKILWHCTTKNFWTKNNQHVLLKEYLSKLKN